MTRYCPSNNIASYSHQLRGAGTHTLALSLSLSFGRCCPLPNDFCENTRICSPDGDPGDHLTIVQLLLLLVSLLCSGACCFSARSKPLKNKNKQTNHPCLAFSTSPAAGAPEARPRRTRGSTQRSPRRSFEPSLVQRWPGVPTVRENGPVYPARGDRSPELERHPRKTREDLGREVTLSVFCEGGSLRSRVAHHEENRRQWRMTAPALLAGCGQRTSPGWMTPQLG